MKNTLLWALCQGLMAATKKLRSYLIIDTEPLKITLLKSCKNVIVVKSKDFGLFLA